ncbi:MAG: signal recognition particle protein [Nitrospirae bacterium CG_4_10_14_0_8_um_filter_41_23]|nr:signal recognition particle protein [Nitrospirota bacterium]OIP60504.1 MAG: signal recognition particle protein [Nitrospirae bacterium CG2_30_41_42]PIQ94524.1 MAG: signal recognition particle protein [Nitrospirae bacterium CG11_big_fil_rev_8_21_14_0_20_41_14]PIV42915.1 MAG: signal recognition particle protein [Nitrospirae bacterium CG02_land_8_20_14_3_00_41_53]PIW87796.1 MAG: signal recognition particle protein [Nitrospirae bacterium CG_4_8_14_3_um_filter_41_47]PIY86907.1 MAG: signal recogn
MFESLTEKLESIFKRLKGKGLLKEEDVELALKEIRLALLEADVNFKVVKDFIQKIKEKAIGKEILESLTPGQQVIKIVNEELCELLGKTNSKIQLSPNPPTIIMMVGLHGSGKTTTSAKLARLFKKEGRRPLLVAADLQRPAAIDQLIILGSQIDVPVYHSKEANNPINLCNESLKKAKIDARDIVILDTAGRLHIDDSLMTELKKIKENVSPKEVMLVVDAMTGQDSVNIAKNFEEQIGIDGIILTKMDGDARGGAALSMRAITGKPIKFIGVGEKIEMLESFYPERIASRILGMGDVLSFIEKAQKSFDQKEAEKLQKAIIDESFTFDDLKSQLKKVRNMGPIENILGMIPGFNKIKNLDIDEREFVKVEAIINSMTKKEKKDHNIINGSRRRRIATGSGTTVADVNRVIKQYVELKKMLKMFKGKKMVKLPKFLPF